MVNLSPTEESYYESYCSLKFAAQVNACELGKPKRQIKDFAPASSSSSAPMEQEVSDEAAPASTPAPAAKTAASSAAGKGRSTTAPATTPSKSTASKRPRVAGAATAASASRLHK